MEQIRVAAQLNTVRDYCRTEAGVIKALEEIKAIGYDGVEIEGINKIISNERLAEVLDSLNLAVASTRNKHGRTLVDLDGMIEEANALGAKNVSIGMMTGSQSTEEAVDKYLDTVKPMVERLTEAGLRATHKLMIREFMRLPREVFNTPERQEPKPFLFDLLRERSDSDKLYFELDTFNLAMAGVNLEDVLADLPGRVRVIRFRDIKISEYELNFFYAEREPCPLGEGVLDFASYMPFIRKAGIEWITAGQNLGTRDPFEELAMSFDHLIKLV